MLITPRRVSGSSDLILPVKSISPARCGSTGAIEISDGPHRLVVNCGGAALEGQWITRDLAQGLRTTAAHSTLVLNDSNSTALLPDGTLGRGVREVTLLGQNVNAYGVSFAADERLREDPMNWSDMPRDRSAFAKLLRACGDIEGLERVRFTSPHPAEFTDDVIEAMAQTPNVCPTLHMPLQSGSDRILKAMRRSYRAERYLGIIDKVRAAIPHAAITTDIIVGFPGETEEDFQATLDVVERSRFASAFTFQYSIRPGTPAAEMPDQLPKAVVTERYQRLIELQERISLEENQAQIGRPVELLVATGEGRKDASTARMSGRARDGRLVHFTPGAEAERIRPGDVVTTTVTGAAPHHLIADAPLATHRRTRAGDAHEAGQRPRTGVGLGLPRIGAPETAPSSGGCGC